MDQSQIVKQDNPTYDNPTDVNELAIWWLSQAECEAISTKESLVPEHLPEYLQDEYTSRYGRPGRGRLWVSLGEGFLVNDIAWPDPETPIAKHCGNCGGIVFWRKHLSALSMLPGLITDMNLKRL